MRVASVAGEIRVTWRGGPDFLEVQAAMAGYARNLNGERQEPTLWVSGKGTLACIWPGAERIQLQRHDATGLVQTTVA